MDRVTVNAPHIGRIRAFDLLRGFFLIVILLNHLFYYPSGLEIFTGRGELYVSTAEGFFLLSGIVLGIVRGRKLIAKPLKVASKLLLKRSLQLYLTFIVLTVLFTLIGWVFYGQIGLKPTPASPATPLLELIWRTLTFQYLYGWADFLRLYVLFLLASPLALWLLRQGWWYIVLLISFGVWSLFPLSSGDYWAMPISWQLVFFSGLVIGFHWPEFRNFWQRLSARARTYIGASLIALTIITIIGSVLLVFVSRMSGDVGSWLAAMHAVMDEYFNKDRLPLPRLLLGAIWFWGIFWLVRRYEPAIHRTVGWLLTPLGVNSLYVYTVQSFIVFFMHLFVLLPLGQHFQAPWYINLMASLFAISLVWILVKKKVLFKIIPR